VAFLEATLILLEGREGQGLNCWALTARPAHPDPAALTGTVIAGAAELAGVNNSGAPAPS
jgi:hypothetical protein